MDISFDKVHGHFGFGCMRLPGDGAESADAEFCAMIDAFLDAGFNYFDTAHGYLDGNSEKALKRCLTSRYPRERYSLTDKLTTGYFHCEADIRPFFESQLEACGVSYFDFYLMHAQSAARFEEFKRCRAYETAFALKEEGKIRHVGISFHDRPEVLEQILTEYPQIEVVQIQFNYKDYEDPVVLSRRVYEVCRKHQKPVIVMEPVKGGRLVELPKEAQAALDTLQPEGARPSNASYALRFAAGFEGMFMVLSGMGSTAMMEDNLRTMTDFQPLSARELEAIEGVRRAFYGKNLIPCTACRYCTAGCPMQIPIPDLFACFNSKQAFDDWQQPTRYRALTKDGGAASSCIACGQCEAICPQHLPVRKLLKTVAGEFE